MEELRDTINKVLGGHCDINKEEDRITLMALILVKLSEDTDLEISHLKTLVDEAKKKQTEKADKATICMIGDDTIKINCDSDEFYKKVTEFILKSFFDDEEE